MLERVESYWEESSPRIALHVALAVALFFLLAVKVLIPRFFSGLGKNLFFLGIGVYVTAFTLVGITGGYYLVRVVKSVPYVSHAEIPRHILDERLGKELFISKCSTCHMLKDIMKPRSVESWEQVVNEMVELAEPRINIDEASQILHYLTLTHVPEPFSGFEKASLIEKHCLPCHQPKEIYGQSLSRTAWKEIVEQMNEYDSEIVPKDKINEIVDFLSKGQESTE
jgi:hypothetical protein